MNDSKDPIAWLRRAAADGLSIENNINSDEIPWDNVAFTAHEMAEKALKAFILYRGAQPPHTHDLQLLRASSKKLGLDADDLFEDCRLLGQLTANARYPDDWVTVDESMGRATADAGRRIFNRVEAAIGETETK